MADFFHEVEEDVKRERYEKLWKAYGKYFLAGVAAIVIGTAGTVFWRDYQTRQREAESERFTAALELARAGRNADAANAFSELAQAAGTGYRVLARFRAAAALIETGDSAGAVATYDSIAADDGAGAVLGDLARLLAAAALIETGDSAGAVATYDSIAADDGAGAVLGDLARLLAARTLVDAAPAGEVEARLAPLLGEQNPWRHSARELGAVLALKSGKVAAARKAFQALADDLTAPSAVRARGAEMLAALGASG